MNNRDYLRLAPQGTIEAALSKDAAVLSSKCELFKLNNAVTYDLAINTWLLAIRDPKSNSRLAAVPTLTERKCRCCRLL